MDSVSNTAFVTLSRLRPRPFMGGGLGGLLPFCGVLFVGTAWAQAPGPLLLALRRDRWVGRRLRSWRHRP